ncbi:MAG: TonB-dependent receptor [Phascolarctobacterium sp.]|nr:TonB-dependent receptor [Phascolarctobacterium sp.]
MKKMNKGMLMAALICGVVQWGGTPVHASELQEFALDEYVVTAARTETKLVDTPANISVVDAQTIEERHYQDVSEVLKDVPGANVLDNGNGANEKKIMLNGDERVLIMVDGRRLNFDMGTMSRSGYDMNMLPDIGLVERIEVLKGASGALYGSDAVGGVVNIITKKADRSYGKVSVGFGSHDKRDMSAMYSFKEGKTGVTVSAAKEKQGYYKYRDAATDSTKRWPADSKYENEKVSLLVEQDVTEESTLAIGYDYNKVEGWNAYNVKSSYPYPIEKKTENIYLKYDWTINGSDNGYIQYYHNELEYFYETMKNEKTNGIDLQQEVNVSDDNKLVIGTSWRESKVYNIGKYAEEKKIDNTAFFINDTWEFAPTWTLNAGVRYDDHSEAGDESTLSAGLNKKFDENSHAYINWGQIFRTPTTDDLYYIDTWNMGNPDLKAETGETWTIGYNTKVGKNTDLGINYFESDIDDAIDWLQYDPSDSYKVRATNIAKQEKRGMELTVNHKLNDNVALTGSYTYLHVKNNYDNNGFLRDYHYMPNTYRVGIHYTDGKWDSNIWLRAGSGGSTSKNARYGYAGYVDYNSVSYCDSSYWTIDMAITYKATKDLSFYAKGYNLFNEAYAEQAGTTNGSYDYPAQSRRFIVGAEYKF